MNSSEDGKHSKMTHSVDGHHNNVIALSAANACWQPSCLNVGTEKKTQTAKCPIRVLFILKKLLLYSQKNQLCVKLQGEKSIINAKLLYVVDQSRTGQADWLFS